MKGSVPVYEWETDHGRVLKLDAPPSPKNGKEAEPLFSALPADTKRPPATAAPLYEFVHKQSGARAYSTETAMSGYKQTERPLCLVWRAPIQVKFP